MPTMSMELTVVIPFVPASLVALLLHHQAAAAAADVETPAPRNGCGFSLRVVSSPGFNRTIRVDGDGFLRFGDRFSYCLFGPQSPDRHGFLRFGDDAPGTGHMQRVNILFKNYHTAEYGGYFVELAGLSIAETKVRGVDRDTFRRSRSGVGGTVIDAGTGTMVMVLAAYDRLVQRVEEQLGQPLVRGSEYRLCLCGATNAVWTQLPTVTLHFKERGVELVLRPPPLVILFLLAAPVAFLHHHQAAAADVDTPRKGGGGFSLRVFLVSFVGLFSSRLSYKIREGLEFKS